MGPDRTTPDNRPDDVTRCPPTRVTARRQEPTEASLKTLEARIDGLLRRDRILAVAFAVAMWVVLVFVCAVALTTSPSPSISVALVVAALLLGGFNTASVVAMVRRYRLSKEAVYGPDIEFADRLRDAKRQARDAKRGTS
jgi:hypothetical protein